MMMPSLPPLDLIPEENPPVQEPAPYEAQPQQNNNSPTADVLPSPKSPARLEEQEDVKDTLTTTPQRHDTSNANLHAARSVLAPRKFEPPKLSALEHQVYAVDNTGNDRKNEDLNAKIELAPMQAKGLPHPLASHRPRLPSLSMQIAPTPALHIQQLPPISDSPPAYVSASKSSDPAALKPLNQPPPLPSMLANSLNKTPLPFRPLPSLTPTRNQPLPSTPGAVRPALVNESPSLPHSTHQTQLHAVSHPAPQQTMQQSPAHSIPQTVSRAAPHPTPQSHATSHSASHVASNELQHKQTFFKPVEDTVTPAAPEASTIQLTSALPLKPTTASSNATSAHIAHQIISKIDQHNIRPTTPTNRADRPSTPTDHSNPFSRIQSKSSADSAAKISTNPPQSHASRAPSNVVHSNARLAKRMSVSTLPMPMPMQSSSHQPMFNLKSTHLAKSTLLASNPSHAALRTPAMLPPNSDHPPNS